MREPRGVACRRGGGGRRLLAFGLPLLILGGGCQRAPSARSLLLVTLDTTRADRLGAYGYEGARTPTLDRLARGGTLYERAYAAVPETLPSHTSMLTGLYPPSHGVRLNLSFRLASEAATLPEILAARGLRTAAVTAAAVLDRRYGLDQGFGVYDDPPGGRGLVERPAQQVTERALEVAEGFGHDPWFLWVHYYDPHSPFQPRAPFAAPPDVAPESPELYDLEIASMDHWLGVLLEELGERGLLEETAIIVVADHGESLGEHGETYHTLYVYDATQHVPLIVEAPGAAAGRRIATPVPTVDVFATALALLGVEPPVDTSSRPLPGLGLAGDGSETRPRAIYSESMAPPLRFGWATLQAVRVPGWLYVRAPREELYDLTADPAQRRDLAYTEESRLAQMRRLLGRALRQMPRTGFGDDSTRQVSDQERRQIAALGYLAAGGDVSEPSELQGEDPKDMVEVSEAFQLSRLARRLDRLETAEELLHFVVTADPENPAGWEHYGEVMLALRRFDDARDALVRGLQLRPSASRILLLLAAAEREIEDTGAAAWHLQEALRLSPFPGEVWREIARLRLALRDWEGAAEAYHRVLEHEPGDERATWALGQLDARSFLAADDAPGAETTESPAAGAS